jgi:tetratricopeptide (TPR) repeat protein
MILRKRATYLAALILMSQTTLVAAAPDSDWQAGQNAFAGGDIASALLHFESAREQGMSGPAVHYNIGVCQFELGDFAQAQETFRLIADRYPQMRGLAEYNIGLTERRLGNSDAAQRQFINAFRHTSDTKIQALAAAQLGELEREQPSELFGSVNINAGHDDNVALRDSLGLPAGVSAESPMADVFATVQAALPGDVGLMFDGSLYAVTYPDADDFDQSELSAGLVHTWDTHDWRLNNALHVTAGTLGGSSFNREINVDVRATRYLGDEASFEMRLRYDDIRGARAQFDGIDGSRTRFRLRYRWYRLSHSLSLRIGLEENDRRDAGVSPSRQRVQASYYYKLGSAWETESSVAFRRSDYDDLTIPRTEDLTAVIFGAHYAFGNGWRTSLRYQYSDNDSSDPLFSYDRNVVTLGVQRLFQR